MAFAQKSWKSRIRTILYWSRSRYISSICSGSTFDATCLACKGDAIANLQEDLAAEQKARATYEKLIDLCADDKDVVDVLKYLRQREIVHFQRFGEALRGVQDKMAEKKFYVNQMNNCNCRE